MYIEDKHFYPSPDTSLLPYSISCDVDPASGHPFLLYGRADQRDRHILYDLDRGAIASVLRLPADSNNNVSNNNEWTVLLSFPYALVSWHSRRSWQRSVTVLDARAGCVVRRMSVFTCARGLALDRGRLVVLRERDVLMMPAEEMHRAIR